MKPGDSERRPERLAWALLVAVGVISVLGVIGSTVNNRDLALHQVPTAACVAWLVIRFRKHPFDALSYGLIFAFMLVHIIGARYLYSNVPYDAWCDALLGFQPTETFGLSRNHYDRFVHLTFGLWIVRPARQLIEQRVTCTRGFAYFLAIGVIVVIGAIYEILECLIALSLSEEAAENYNGQQGDMWDAQKDQILALLGAGVAAAIESWWTRPGRERPGPSS